MKNNFLLALLFTVTNSLGQTLADFHPQRAFNKLLPNINLNDTTLKVSYVTKLHDQHLPAVYLNGRLVNLPFFCTIDLNLIDSVNVNKDSLQIGSVKYYGQIYIKTKKSYSPKIISLTELKEKYTKLKSEPAIFMVDGEIITCDYDDYVVDENLLWRIFVNKVENEKEKINMKFIKVLTKSEENLKKPAVIRIRGTEIGPIE